jgi:SAM-dependent methyltransferase
MPQENLFPPGSLVAGYDSVYGTLTELREAFHRSGRFDDSNAKLDEVAKLFAAYLAFVQGLIPNFPQPDAGSLVLDLHKAFDCAAALPRYCTAGGTSIFGTNPALNLRQGDEVLAEQLTTLVRRSVDLAFELQATQDSFDVLNEAFGHFVRDNFRGNIEDAQYLTPPEVVDFMVDIAIADISRDERGYDRNARNLTVLDPSCGVGSFLATVYNRARQDERLDTKRLRLFGQDKVERMVRLSTLNLELFHVREHRITLGNSLSMGSPLDDLNGQVDLILTNPPFGARFDRSTVRNEFGQNTPFFSSLPSNGGSLDSELLFIDRNLELLRNGGRLLIVVPDGVISARGTAAMLRHHLRRVTTVLAIIELPAVTFAQAGTRTKTAILYLRKGGSAEGQAGPVFMGVATDLGYQVASRKGVQVKVPSGTNEMRNLASAYMGSAPLSSLEPPVVCLNEPSAVFVQRDALEAASWTPNHHHAKRYSIIADLRSGNSVELRPLRELVEFVGDSRRREAFRPGMRFISVLHVLGEGLLDIDAIYQYAPQTPGIPIKVGEILLSRINPRIPRVCIVPDLDAPLLCSSEFEVMRPRDGLDPFLLAYLLQTRAIQQQITSLTSGTSASHSRIKSADLAMTTVPLPVAGSERHQLILKLTREYREAVELITINSIRLRRLREQETRLLN